MESAFDDHYCSQGDFMTVSDEGQPPKAPKLMEQMRAVLRVQRYALRTEKAYCDWVRRYVKFHGMKSRADLGDGTRKVEDFLTPLAVVGKVAAATQNQALNALLFLYDRVLEQPLGERVDAVRAARAPRVPMVLTVEEARRLIGLLSGVPQLVVKVLYGSGLRLMEALRLRVKDVDFKMLEVVVRSGKGGKERVRPRFAGFEIADFKLQMGHADVSTTMIYTHVLRQGGLGVRSPLDG